MADKTFVLEFRQVTTGDGAQRLVEDINRVKALTDNVTGAAAQAPNALDPLVKSADELAEKIPAAEREMQRFLQANGMAANEAGRFAGEIARGAQNLPGFKDALEGVIGPASAGEFNVNALKKSVMALGSESAAVSSLGLAGLVLGLGMLVKGAYESSEPIANLILNLQGLNDEAVDASGAVANLEKEQLRLDKQGRALDDLKARLQSDKQEAEGLISAINRLEQAELSAALARIKRESAKRVAESGNDPAVEAAEKARVDTETASLTGKQEESRAQREVTKANDEVARLAYERASLERKLNQATVDRQKYEEAIRGLAERLQMQYEEAVTLATNSNKLRAEIEAAQKSGDQARAGALTSMKDAGKGFETADRTVQKAESGLDTNRQAQETAALGLREAAANLSAVQDKTALALQEAGKSYGEASRDLGVKIAEMTARLAEAKGGLAVAQGSTGAPASGAEQTDAYNKVMQIEQELARLRQLQEQASREVSDSSGRFGESFTTGARSVQAASASAAAAVDGAGQKITATTQVATNAVSAAAERVVQATAEGVGGIAEGMTKVGTAVNATADRVVSGLDGIARTLEQRLNDIDRRISTVDAVAKSASRQAEIATSQIANQR
jgi:chromosome segregation ATPase